MKKILVASTNKSVIQTVYDATQKYAEYFDAIYCPDTDEALSFLDYELPEIKVLDFTSEDIDAKRIISAIDADPWLHNGGIIAVAENQPKAQALEELKNPNILIVQTLNLFEENFERLLKILWGNQQFLFNRGMQDRMGVQEKGSFLCDNDLMDIRLYTSFLVNYLYASNRIDEDGRYSLQTTLMELLTNALEHGNCGITYDEKSKWLNEGKLIRDLIEQKREDPVVAAKKIHIHYHIGKANSQFMIKDEGEGFDWKSQAKNYENNVYEAHGRGIALSKQLVTKLRYNEKGNAVIFEINNLRDASNNVPGIMIPFATASYGPRDIVCHQNEPSNDLYFIVSGRYGVYADGKLISVLTPADMFIGEMAFLLNDRRSATIMSASDGKLIRIPKTAFLNLIRKNPHYGIFLSKLLAQRVVKQNQRTVDLATEIGDLKKELNDMKKD